MYAHQPMYEQSPYVANSYGNNGSSEFGTTGYTKPAASHYGSAAGSEFGGGYGSGYGGGYSSSKPAASHYGSAAGNEFGGGYGSSHGGGHNSSGYGSGYTSGGSAEKYNYDSSYDASAQYNKWQGGQPTKFGPNGSDIHGGRTGMPPYGAHQGKPSSDPIGDSFLALAPSSFPPGTDPKIIDCFNKIDKDGNGFIDDRELQMALSNFNQSFSMRTVHLLMYKFTHSNTKTIGTKEFVPLMSSLSNWKTMFARFDRDRNGRIDVAELRNALCSIGCVVPHTILNLLISKFDKQGGGKCSIGYDNFIEACVIILGLTESFKSKEDSSGTATFTYEEFLLSVLPFVVN